MSDYLTFNTIIENLVEENDIPLSNSTISKLAKRAKQLQEDDSITADDDIFEELQEVLPKNKKEDDDVMQFLEELVEIIQNEKEELDDVDDSSDEEDY